MTTISAATVAQELEAFIRSRFQVSPGDSHFNSATNLWDDGYIDSLGFVEVVSFLETRFEVKIPTEIVFEPAFTHIAGIAELTFRLVSQRDARRSQPGALAQAP